MMTCDSSDTDSGEERNHEDSEGASEWTNAKQGMVGDQQAALEQGWNISHGRRVLARVVPGGAATPQRSTSGETHGESGGNKNPLPPRLQNHRRRGDHPLGRSRPETRRQEPRVI
jgi:hypothetical protein